MLTREISHGCFMMPALPSFDILFEHMPDAVYLIDPASSNILWCNRAGYEDLGLDAADVLDHSVVSLQKDVRGMPQWTDIAHVIRSVPVYTFVGRHRHRDGGEIAVEVNTSHFSHEGREYFLSIARNINKRIATEQRLNESAQQNWFVLNESMDGLWDWNVTTGEVFFSPKLKQILGYGPDEMQPKVETWSNNIHPEDKDYVLAALQQHMDGRRGRYEAEYRIMNRNGYYMWIYDRGKITEYDQHGQPQRIIGMMQNITDRKLLELHLEHLAHLDDLTQLANRRAGMNQLSQMLQQAETQQQPLCVGVIDIDNFKHINDQYGHPMGDEVIAGVAQMLRQHLRKTDYVFRMGGEEFVFLLPNTSIDEAQQLERTLHTRLRDIDWLGGYNISQVTFSIGIACFPEDTQNKDHVLTLADKALYQAKENGRNRTCFAAKDGQTP